MALKRINTSKGFTLVELLVVMVIMGLVITSVYSLFLNSKKTANTSEEVVDVQQNVRVAMETLVTDIRMAGFLVDGTPIITAPATLGVDDNDDGDLDDTEDSGEYFSFQTCSARKTYARILNEDAGGAGLIVEADMAPLFVEEDLVTIIRPTTNNSIFDLLEVDYVTVDDRTNNRIPLATSPTNTDDPAGYAVASVGSIKAGDMIVRKIDDEALPATDPNYAPTIIRYWLRPAANGGSNNFELMRGVVNAAAPTTFAETSLIASNIPNDAVNHPDQQLQLTYLLEDGTETAAPADLDQIRAIRINISGQTDNTKTGLDNYSGVKTRNLQTVVKIQNAFGG
ncbi:MAG: prepilin-type N-terminal cleavage/methylation domain-containing protein [Desulfuromonas sp.]|nr:prepilin-type N-terminal cleavage/methylation domain-containing protein [Desulfuromonas sp.]